MRIELRLRTEAAGGSAACKFQFCNQQQDGMVWDGGREGREATHHWIPNLALIQFYVWSRWKSRVPEEEPKRGRESQQNPPNANEPRTMKMGDDRLWALHSRRRMKCTREQGSVWNVVEPLSLGAAFDMPAVFDPYWNLPPEHTQKNIGNFLKAYSRTTYY